MRIRTNFIRTSQNSEVNISMTDQLGYLIKVSHYTYITGQFMDLG